MSIKFVKGKSMEEEGGGKQACTFDGPLNYSVHIFGFRKFLTPHIYENLQDRGMREYKRKHSDR